MGKNSDDATAAPPPPPREPGLLKEWLLRKTGVRICEGQVCRDHSPPWTYFQDVYVNRPPLALVLGPRGGGKSFLSALGTHLTSRWNDRHGTIILGGSKAQSLQVYRALREAVYLGKGTDGSDADSIVKLMREEAIYANGSEVAIVSASPTSVRGPHVPSLILDEVDEIDFDIRESAMGMCMAKNGSPASTIMTSTCHRVDGPMSQMIDLAHANSQIRFHTFCAFEVLESCSEERSGPRIGGDDLYENCPRCPIRKWCHSERDRNGNHALAKLSHGHYAIDSLVQKVHATSIRTFESDYLCKGPRTDSLWFPDLDTSQCVHERAEYDRGLPVHIAIDSGVFTGAVFFQTLRYFDHAGVVEEVHVFADYLSEGLTAERNARAILEKAWTLCQGRRETISTDMNGNARNAVGPTVIAEYERAGLGPIKRWPYSRVADGLALVESFLMPADGVCRLIFHPRCEATIRAFQLYRRLKRDGQYEDAPVDPQHPHEDLVDSLRGGLKFQFPQGRIPVPVYRRLPAGRIF